LWLPDEKGAVVKPTIGAVVPRSAVRTPLGWLGPASVVCVLAGVALMAALHVVPPSSAVDPVRRTLSEYALGGNRWVFDLAVLLIAASSVALGTAMIQLRIIGPRSVSALALAAWIVSLVLVVVFTKHNWAVEGPSIKGHIHRVASVVAMLSLPLAAIITGRAYDRRGRAARLLGWTSLLCLAPILYAVVSAPWTGVSWWRAIPLGLVERVLWASEVATLLALVALVLFPPRGRQALP
jgi:hypothetical protein